MKIGPKYKIARRLGAAIFEKTQTPKFEASLERKMRGKRPMHSRTDFAIQMKEKQKARYIYGINNRQFGSYVKDALLKGGSEKPQRLFNNLEKRLDNVIFRAGFAPTRRASRQMVSHGHVKVGEKKITVPSHSVKVGDKISIKESSITKGMFTTREEQLLNHTAPSWIKVDSKGKSVSVEGEPKLEPGVLLFDPDAVLEFYSR